MINCYVGEVVGTLVGKSVGSKVGKPVGAVGALTKTTRICQKLKKKLLSKNKKSHKKMKIFL